MEGTALPPEQLPKPRVSRPAGSGSSGPFGARVLTQQWSYNDHRGKKLTLARANHASKTWAKKTRMHTAEELDSILDEGMKYIQIKIYILTFP